MGQFGFKSKRYLVDNVIITLLEEVLSSLKNQKPTIWYTYQDLTKTFDTVDNSELLFKIFFLNEKACAETFGK